MAENYVVSTCTIVTKETYKYAECKEIQVSKEQLERYEEQLKDYLLAVYCSNTASYDNSDDDRASCSERSWGTVRHYEIEPKENSKYLIVDGDKVIGVKFVIKDGSYDKYTYKFLFDESIQSTFRMGYSASHSSSWTYINRVLLTKRGENGAPNKGGIVRFEQTRMYPSF